MADFAGFTPGRIALIQRGSCFFGVKVLNAQAAGASGVIIFNEGNPGRTGVLAGSLVDANGNPIIPTIPGLHILRHRPRSLQPVSARDAAGHEPQHSGDRQTERS
jgi:hypothetical protein